MPIFPMNFNYLQTILFGTDHKLFASLKKTLCDDVANFSSSRSSLGMENGVALTFARAIFPNSLTQLAHKLFVISQFPASYCLG